MNATHNILLMAGLLLSGHALADDPIRILAARQNVNAPAMEQPLDWYQGERLIFNFSASTATNARDLTASNLVVVWDVASATNLQQIYLAQTGLVANAAAGLIRFDAPPSNSCLPAGRYISLVRAFTLDGGGISNELVLGRQSALVRYKIDSRAYGVRGPLTFAWPVAGPQGPAGTNGAPGAAGPAGPAGSNGVDAVQLSPVVTLATWAATSPAPYYIRVPTNAVVTNGYLDLPDLSRLTITAPTGTLLRGVSMSSQDGNAIFSSPDVPGAALVGAPQIVFTTHYQTNMPNATAWWVHLSNLAVTVFSAPATVSSTQDVRGAQFLVDAATEASEAVPLEQAQTVANAAADAAADDWASRPATAEVVLPGTTPLRLGNLARISADNNIVSINVAGGLVAQAFWLQRGVLHFPEVVGPYIMERAARTNLLNDVALLYTTPRLGNPTWSLVTNATVATSETDVVWTFLPPDSGPAYFNMVTPDRKGLSVEGDLHLNGTSNRISCAGGVLAVDGAAVAMAGGTPAPPGYTTTNAWVLTQTNIDLTAPIEANPEALVGPGINMAAQFASGSLYRVRFAMLCTTNELGEPPDGLALTDDYWGTDNFWDHSPWAIPMDGTSTSFWALAQNKVAAQPTLALPQGAYVSSTNTADRYEMREVGWLDYGSWRQYFVAGVFAGTNMPVIYAGE